jgi:two-component system chemotaxis response regulator CheY
MISHNDDLALQYLAESSEQLASLEADLLAIEKSGAAIDEGRLTRTMRVANSIKQGAGFFDWMKIRELAHKLEDVLGLIRSGAMVPTEGRIRVLLGAADRLRELMEHAEASNRADTSESMAALARVCRDFPSPTGGREDGGHEDGGRLRVLLVEDDFTSRLVLQTFLSRYGECHIAVNGREAVAAVRGALERGERYDLICMDILMPEMNGREAVRNVRALEEEHGILSTAGAKIIMTTAVDEVKEVIECFKELCDAYLVKPIDLTQLLGHMKTYQLIR